MKKNEVEWRDGDGGGICGIIMAVVTLAALGAAANVTFVVSQWL